MPDYQDIVELFGLVPPEPDAALQAELEAEEEIAGESNDSALELADKLMREGEYQKAVRQYTRAIEHGEGDLSSALTGLAGAYECLEMSPQALRQYQRVLKLRQDSPEPHVGLSDIYRRNGRVMDAVKQLEEAINLDPGNAFLHVKMAESLRSNGYREKALTAMRLAVLLDPEQSFHHYWMGDLLVEMKRYDEALAALHAAIELSPGDDALLAKAGIAFWGAGRVPEAIKAIRLASELDPDNLKYYGLLERFYTLEGMPTEADMERKKAAAMDDYDRDGLQRMLAQAGIGLG